MSPERKRQDLIILAADKDIEATLKELLSRSQAFQMRPIDVTILVHP